MSHLDRLLKKLEELRTSPTPDQLIELKVLQEEIDRIYAMIVANQQAFTNALWITKNESCCNACKEDDGGVCSNKRGSV